MMGGQQTLERIEFDKLYDIALLPHFKEIADNNSLITLKNAELCKQELYREYSVLNKQYKDSIFKAYPEDKKERHC